MDTNKDQAPDQEKRGFRVIAKPAPRRPQSASASLDSIVVRPSSVSKPSPTRPASSVKRPVSFDYKDYQEEFSATHEEEVFSGSEDEGVRVAKKRPTNNFQSIENDRNTQERPSTTTVKTDQFAIEMEDSLPDDLNIRSVPSPAPQRRSSQLSMFDISALLEEEQESSRSSSASSGH